VGVGWGLEADVNRMKVLWGRFYGSCITSLQSAKRRHTNVYTNNMRWREETDQLRSRLDFKEIRVEVLNELTWIRRGIRYRPLLLQAKTVGSAQEEFVDQMCDCDLKLLRRTLIHAIGNLSV